MKIKYTAKTNMALRLTILAYQRLIESPDKNVKKWARYGSSWTCRLCNSTPGCGHCPLNGNPRGCADGPTMERLIEQIKRYRNPGWRDTRELVRAARARLKWIRKRAKENGAKV